MLIKEANKIVGGLSNPSKMPGKSFNLPAKECNIGSKLNKIAGTVCFDCYARKGRYLFPTVQKALYRRLEKLTDSKWVDAMVTLIKKQSPDYFRWHDSGDLQSMAHLLQILVVCKLTPDCRHWLPTKEGGLLLQLQSMIGLEIVPDNLTIRLSAPFVDSVSRKKTPFLGSTVYTHGKEPADSYLCPASKQENQCGDCRACWGKDHPLIAYPKH